MDIERITIRRIAGEIEIDACARMMAANDPWITLRRGYEESLAILRDPAREVYVAVDDVGDVAGFLILIMHGALVGYIQTVAVGAEWRRRGLGTRLIAFAEERIFAQAPNAFLMVSSFNPRAKSLYERLGYAAIGELRDYIVRGHSEWLLRKSIGPLADWTSGAPRLPFDTPPDDARGDTHDTSNRGAKHG